MYSPKLIYHYTSNVFQDLFIDFQNFGIDPDLIIKQWDSTIEDASKNGKFNCIQSIKYDGQIIKEIIKHNPKFNINDLQQLTLKLANCWLQDIELTAIPMPNTDPYVSKPLMYNINNQLYDFANSKFRENGYWEFKFNVQIINTQLK